MHLKWPSDVLMTRQWINLMKSTNNKISFRLVISIYQQLLNTLRLRQNGRHYPDDIFKFIFLNKNIRISIKISLRSVPEGPINKIPAQVQIMAWCHPGNKPLSEPMVVSLLMHICVTRPQWVKMYIEANQSNWKRFFLLEIAYDGKWVRFIAHQWFNTWSQQSISSLKP